MGKLFARDGGKTSEEGATRLISRLFSQSGTLAFGEGRVMAAPTPNNTVRITRGDLVIGNNSPSASTYYYHGWIDADSSVTIQSNVSGSARIDSIVAFVDKAVQDIVNSDNPTALKFVAVQGTPAGSPVPPSNAAIVTAVGTGNPYYVLANVAVANGFSVITNANITDVRTIAQTVMLGDGWNVVNETWTFQSSTVINVPSDARARFAVGDKISWVQTTIRFAVVTLVEETRITVAGDTVANAAITIPRHSKVNPNGFGEIRAAQIANDAVTSPKIANGAVTDEKLNWSTFGYGQLVFSGVSGAGGGQNWAGSSGSIINLDHLQPGSREITRPSVGVLRVAKAGIYSIVATATFTDAPNELTLLSIMINGQYFSPLARLTGTGTNRGVTVSMILNLAANSDVSARIDNTSASPTRVNWSVSREQCSLTVARIG